MTTTSSGPSEHVDTAQLGDDDRLHVPADHKGWRESYYFSFYDDAAELGGFTSIGRRPAPGHIGSINVVWGPDRPTLVASELDRSEGHGLPYRVLGLTYDCETPFGTWRLRFDGSLNDGGTEILCDPAAVAAAGPDGVAVSYDLEFIPDSPAYSYDQRPEWKPLFTGHVDQTGVVRGTVTIDGVTTRIDGRGGKDHSWGVRDWFAPSQWRWVDLVTSDGLTELALWRATFDGESWVGDGALFGDGSTHALTALAEDYDTTERAVKPMPARWSVTASTETDELSFAGDVVRVCPVIFGGGRYRSWNDRVLVVGQTGDGRSAWANVEFAARIDTEAT